MKKRTTALLLTLCLLLTSACAGSGSTDAAEDVLQLEAFETSESPPPEEDQAEDPEPVEEGPALTLEAIRSITFDDVSTEASYADCVSYAAHQSFLGGVGGRLFDPEGLVSRAMVLTALHRISGQEAPAYSGTFDDVGAEDWYADAVSWAVEAGLADAGGKLGPTEPVTRSELAVLLYRFAIPDGSDAHDTELVVYSDGGYVPEYALTAMAWALENRLFAGIISDTIYPNLPVSRAQLAQVLVALAAYSREEPVAQALTTQLNAKIAVSLAETKHDDIQLLVDTTASKYGATGVQVAVVDNGKVVDVYTYGWATKDSVPMSEDHKIRVASLSKVVVGISAMLLREQGLIDLDGELSPYWGIHIRNPYYPDTPITFRTLLSHTSSIRAFDRAGTYSAVKSQLSGSGGYSRLKPGAITSWNYNNYAFGVLGMTLELASDRFLDDIMKENLWSAMDIDAAFEAGRVEATDLMATLYRQGGSVGRSVADQLGGSLPEQPGATGSYFAGGLTISAKDMAKMTALLANDGCYEGVRLMKAESVELMETRSEQLGDGSCQALSLRSQDSIYGRDRLYYHTGSAYGVYNLMSYDPATGDGVVVLTVGASGAKDSRGIYAVCGEISQSIYEFIG